MIEIIRKDLAGQGLEPQQIIEKAKQSAKGITMSPSTFKSVLDKVVTQAVKEKLTNPVISKLIHYLVREEPDRVSFSKLQQAMQSGRSPLKQEGIVADEELQQYQDQLAQRLSNSKVPLSLIELNNFLERT